LTDTAGFLHWFLFSFGFLLSFPTICRFSGSSGTFKNCFCGKSLESPTTARVKARFQGTSEFGRLACFRLFLFGLAIAFVLVQSSPIKKMTGSINAFVAMNGMVKSLAILITKPNELREEQNSSLEILEGTDCHQEKYRNFLDPTHLTTRTLVTTLQREHLLRGF
jgi:hypothetical protein